MISLRRIARSAFIALIPVAAASALIEPRKMPLGVIAGGVLCLLNLRSLHRSVSTLLGTERPAPRMFMGGMFRILFLGAAVIALAKARAVDLLGLLAGFLLVSFIIVLEGARVAREENADSKNSGNA